MRYNEETRAIRNGKLLAGALSGTLNADEQAEFDTWLADADHRALYESMRQDSSLKTEMSSFDRYDEQSAYPRFLNLRDATQPTKRRRLLKWLPYAAAVAFALAVGFFLLDTSHQIGATRLAAAEILPGGHRATLKLADGRTIDLNEAQTGIVIGNGITYLDGSSVLSEQGKKGIKEQGNKFSASLQLTTPKGGTYQITLSDGTKVWLNAASTLKYPSRFSGADRAVELSGEAYFSVAENEHMPFKVVSTGQEVKVLGTEFNVSAYADDPEIKTTLVTGSVRLDANGASLKLMPGEQAVYTAGKLDKTTINTDQYTAWKDGRFHFDHTPFHEMINQVARWYDVDIVYQGRVPQETFSGKMGRDLTLKAMLNLLNISDADIHTDGRKLIVQ